MVSEIMDKLSPNIAPEAEAATQSTGEYPVACEIPTAKGTKTVIVPTEVPMAKEIKQPIKNRPTTAKEVGRKFKATLTVAVAPPAARTMPEKAPAVKKIRHIVMILSSANPLAIKVIFFVVA